MTYCGFIVDMLMQGRCVQGRGKKSMVWSYRGVNRKRRLGHFEADHDSSKLNKP